MGAPSLTLIFQNYFHISFRKLKSMQIFFFKKKKNSKSKRSTCNCQNPETCIRKEGHHRTSEGSLCNSLRQGTEVSRL